jgi:hypothetical protein
LLETLREAAVPLTAAIALAVPISTRTSGAQPLPRVAADGCARPGSWLSPAARSAKGWCWRSWRPPRERPRRSRHRGRRNFNNCEVPEGEAVCRAAAKDLSIS